MTSWWVSSTGMTRSGSGLICANDSRSSRLELNAEKTRLIEFGRFAAGIGRPGASVSLRRSSFSASRTCARRPGTRGGSSSSGSPTQNGCARSCGPSGSKCGDACISRSPNKGRWLASVLRGHYHYYAVPDNSAALIAFRKRLIRHWLWSLRRRSQRSTVTWERMWRLADQWLPQPRILHPWPEQRFAAITQGRSPVR